LNTTRSHVPFYTVNPIVKTQPQLKFSLAEK